MILTRSIGPSWCRSELRMLRPTGNNQAPSMLISQAELRAQGLAHQCQPRFTAGHLHLRLHKPAQSPARWVLQRRGSSVCLARFGGLIRYMCTACSPQQCQPSQIQPKAIVSLAGHRLRESPESKYREGQGSHQDRDRSQLIPQPCHCISSCSARLDS